jgi:hypothetical protein
MKVVTEEIMPQHPARMLCDDNHVLENAVESL